MIVRRLPDYCCRYACAPFALRCVSLRFAAFRYYITALHTLRVTVYRYVCRYAHSLCSAPRHTRAHVRAALHAAIVLYAASHGHAVSACRPFRVWCLLPALPFTQHTVTFCTRSFRLGALRSLLRAIVLHCVVLPGVSLPIVDRLHVYRV